MEIKTTFRLLLVGSLIIGLLGVAYPFLGLHETSEELDSILEWNGYGGTLFGNTPDNEDVFSTQMIVTLLLGLFLLLGGIAAVIGAFFFKKWGRSLLLITTLISLVSIPLLGIAIVLPIEGFLYEISSAAYYIVLAMAYLPPLKHEFENA